MVNELTWRIQALTTMTEKAGSVGLCVKVEEKCPVDYCQASVEDVETVL